MLDRNQIDELHRLLEEEFAERARRDLLSFVLYTKPDYRPQWFHKYICRMLQRVVDGELRRLIITMPPRHGKSELVSRRLPAFIFGRCPTAQIIATSYSAALASRNNRDVQRIIDSPQYGILFPDVKLCRSNKASGWLRNLVTFEIVGYGGTYRSSGIGGGITGHGFNFGIIDDVLKNRDEAMSQTMRNRSWEWFTTVFMTRMEQDARIIIIATRWHEDDLVGRILQLSQQPGAEPWTIISLPAIKDVESEWDVRTVGEALWPEKVGVDRLNAIRMTMGERDFMALYQQRPAALEGSIIKRSWFKYYTTLPQCNAYVQSWDCAFTDANDSSYVVGQVWGVNGSKYYLIHQVRARLDFINTIAEIKNLSAMFPYATTKLIEDKANGPAIINALQNEVSGIIAFQPRGSKESRLLAVAPLFEAGNIYLPQNAPWVETYLHELCTFPASQYTDQCDATSQALLRLSEQAMRIPSPISLLRVSPLSKV